MKKFSPFLLLVALVLGSVAYKFIRIEPNQGVRGQTSSPVAGGYSAIPSGTGTPSATCNDSIGNLLYVDATPIITSGAGRFWQCNNASGSYTWTNLPVPVPVSYYLNGVAQMGVRCDFLTGTTSAGGTITFNISGMGYASLLGQPQPSVQSASAVVSLGTFSTTSVTLNAQAASVISVVGINVTLLSNAALPVGLYVCGI